MQFFKFLGLISALFTFPVFGNQMHVIVHTEHNGSFSFNSSQYHPQLNNNTDDDDTFLLS